MAVLTKKIKASTIVESLIAMVVVMVSFGIATTVYVHILSSGNQVQTLQSRALLQKLAIETKQNRLFLDEKLVVDGFAVEKTLISYMGRKHLFLLKLKAYNQNEKQVAEYNELIAAE